MPRTAVNVIFVVVMILLIVGLDIAFFREHLLARLLVNVGIVLVFVGFFLRFVKQT